LTLRLPRLTPALLPLLAATFLVGAHNFAFWKTFIGATGGASLAALPIQVGMFVLLVLSFHACLALINYRYVLKPVLMLLLVVTAVASYFMNHYGTPIDWSMVQNIMETDSRESAELLSWEMVLSVCALGVLPALALYLAPLHYGSGRRQFSVNLGMVGASLALALLLLLLMFKSLAPALREHRELRFLLTPTNVIQAVNGYLKRQFSAPVVVAPLGTDARKGPLWSGAARRTVTIIVVGETARAASFSLNGYARPTNPRLAREAGLINFSNMQSCGTATAVSVPCVFSALGRHKYSDTRAKSQEGLLDVFKHAGLDVLWIDNNSGCKGVCDRVRVEDVSQPVAGDPLCDGEECYDERLLRELPARIHDATEDMVIVLHQKGSHGPAYWKRHPAAFGVFGPECRTNDLSQCSRASIVSAYDATILYTDYVLSKAIDLLRESAARDQVDTALVYFSDHGESLGENNLYLHGAPYVIAPEEQRHVPFMLWLSDGFRARFQLDQPCLQARADQEFSHDNIFHSTLGMLDINTAIYNPKLDLFSACRHGR
jgi:lipid A ethanolaminephosphotransferase